MAHSTVVGCLAAAAATVSFSVNFRGGDEGKDIMFHFNARANERQARQP